MFAAIRTALRLDLEDSQRLSGLAGSVDVDELLEVARQNLPDWRGAAKSCTDVVRPLYDAISRTLNDDIETIARVLADTTDLDEDNEDTPSASSSHSSLDIPRIVITRCPDLPRDAATWVPVQDAHFGARLVVPAHSAVNQAFPPLVASSPSWAAKWPERQWRWAGGHWWAILPPPEEQARRGMSSRVHGRKAPRAGLRKCGRH